MLDIKFIRENQDLVKDAIRKKFVKLNLDELITLDDKRRETLLLVENMRAEQKKISDKMPTLSNPIEREQLIADIRPLKENISAKEEELKQIIDDWQKMMVKVPNIPSPDTPEGPDDSGNMVVRTWGEIPKFDFQPKEHDALGEALGIIDTETAAIVAGSRFCYLKGDLVLMQFALIQFCLQLLTNKSKLQEIADGAGLKIKVEEFIPVIPPVFIKPIVQLKMARLMTPEEHYMFPNDDLMLIGSAEHTMGSMYMDKIFSENDLPIRLAGYSTAFRREAGSYGKDMKGILRQHQFDKLEMEVFSLPENSMQEQNFLVAIQEYILQQLNLPYQVVLVCTGDMGFPDSRQFDIETWMPGQNKYRETHSADLTGGFQSRRLNTRVKRSDGKIEPVHMNDATVVAIGRALIAIMENYQEADGRIRIPDVLKPYFGKDYIG